MALTAWCIGVVLTSIVLVGVPLAWIVGGRKPLTEWGWVLAPFLGISAIVLVLQNLVYLDVPIRKATPFFWGLVLMLWLWLGWSKQLRVSLARCPKALYGAVVIVYLVHGLGLLVVGARHYVGTGLWDQFNYTLMAQYVTDQPFAHPLHEAHNRPDLLYVHLMEWHRERIGESILQGFFTASAGSTAKILFEPTIFLSPALTVIAIFGLARCFQLPRGSALATGVVAGLLPSLTQAHQANVLSQALGTPFLLCLPAALYHLSRRPGWFQLAGLAFIFAGTTSIYTEFWPILIGVTLVMLGLVACGHPQVLRLVVSAVVLGLSTFILNPLFTHSFLLILKRLDQSVATCPHMAFSFPWAFHIEGLSRLWMGELAAGNSGMRQSLARACGVALTALGYFGLFYPCVVRLQGGRTTWRSLHQRAALALGVGVLSLALLPVAIGARDDQHPFQFYKILLSVSPLLVLGLAVLLNPLPGAILGTGAGGNRLASKRFPIPCILVMTPVLLMAAVGTIKMTLNTTNLTRDKGSLAHYYHSRPMRVLHDQLERLRNCNLFIPSSSGPYDCWLIYQARHNHIWLGDTRLGYDSIDLRSIDGLVARGQLYGEVLQREEVAEAVRTLQPDARNLPENILVLSSTKGPLGNPRTHDATLIWSSGNYELWKPGSGPLAFATRVDNLNGLEIAEGKSFFWVGKGVTTLNVLANSPGILTVSAIVLPGPSLPPNPCRKLRIQTSGGYLCDALLQRREETFSFPVLAGNNVISLTALDTPTERPAPNGDLRPLLWGVQGLKLRLEPNLKAKLLTEGTSNAGTTQAHGKF